MNREQPKGILLVDKSPGSTSFHIVAQLRRLLKIEKIGHAGTLDPFATGVMVMLIGRDYTRRSDEFLCNDKAYRATLRLGVSTDSYDIEGQVTSQSDKVPTPDEVSLAIATFQGKVSQVPPMFSAKKIQGKKLYELARKGIEIERQPVLVELKTKLIRYEYPELEIEVECSKGTYIRSLAHDIGQMLGCGAHLSSLVRLRSGQFRLEDCISQELFKNREFDATPYLRALP
ncbi:MAG: tRNA pseudouridine(55) synthase TruB [Verrucomicrobia bacterium]|nr:tRNA pseudouridine(55) synthase TruB [Verrucomicrobiota bacterium]